MIHALHSLPMARFLRELIDGLFSFATPSSALPLP
jgi:hypothetical protein